MTRAVALLILGLVVGLPCAVHAAGEPLVRVELEPDAVTVGSPMRLRLTVLVPTWFSGPPRYPSLELANLVVREPPNSSFNVNERVGGESYAGIARDFELYAMVPARYSLEGLEVTVRYADPETRQPLTATVPVPGVSFEASVPAAARGLRPFVPSASLALEQAVDGLDEGLAPGAAVTRTVTARATALPALFLPPLLDDAAPTGLRAYPKSPRVEDSPGERGDPSTGTRTESVTYVVEAPGRFTLPERRLRWWNTEAGRIEEVAVPAVSFEVVPPPGWLSPEDRVRQRAADKRRREAVLAGVVVVVVLAAAVLAGRRRLVAWWTEAARRRAVSEPVLFRQLDDAAVSGDAAEIYRRFITWRDAARQGRGAGSAPSQAPTPPELERALFAGDAVSPLDRSALRVSLGSLRARVNDDERRREGAGGALRPLNP